MSTSKRHRGLTASTLIPHTGQSTRTVSKRSQPIETVSFSPVQAIPTDLLREIFSYISFKPRFYVVSVVCKRWRTATLLGITKVILSSTSSREYKYIDKAIELFPSLTELDLGHVSSLGAGAPECEHLRELRLPPSVTRLHVKFEMQEGLQWEVMDAKEREGAENCDYNPDDESDYSKYDMSITRTIGLLTRNSHVTSLSLCVEDEDKEEAPIVTQLLASLCLPHVKHLTLSGLADTPDLERVLPIVPALESLTVHGANLEQLVAVKTLLTPLLQVNWHSTFNDQSEEEARTFAELKRSLPNLKYIVDGPFWSEEHVDHHTVANKKDWTDLHNFTQIRSLLLQPTAAAPLMSVPLPTLPNLQSLQLGDIDNRWLWCEAMPIVHLVLNACLTLRNVTIWLQDAPRDHFEEFIMRAVQYGIHKLCFAGKGRKQWTIDSDMIQKVREHEWLSVELKWIDGHDGPETRAKRRYYDSQW